MATDSKSRKSTSRSDDSELQTIFAGLSARIRRTDLIASLLAGVLVAACYALLMSTLDFFALGSGTVRWSCYFVFLGVSGFLALRTVRVALRPINPYFVAEQLEQTVPNAKNGLINWLDLHESNLPDAFRKNLGASAVEQFRESDPDRLILARKNWIMLGGLTVPALGLVILLILGPTAFFASMLGAFVPFLNLRQEGPRTQITLLRPSAGDAEASPAESVEFAAKIEGRVPGINRSDAPKLHYRYQTNEDFRTLPLQPGEDGTWTGQLLSAQLRSGFSYKISAGDAETAEHQVRVRARAHVRQFEIIYHHRPYRKTLRTTSTFPNQESVQPFIHGPRGSEVELVVRASQAVKKASVELVTDKSRKELAVRMLPDDPRAFSCRWLLDHKAQFRVLFTTMDGEENADRNSYDIQVQNDEAPTVTLTKPGKKTELPENGTLLLEGRAVSEVGLKNLTLRMRIATGAFKPKLQPKPYRDGKSFRFEADGTYPDAIEYRDFVALNELKDERGTIILLPAGTELEYWLEAADVADYPNLQGNLGKSTVYAVTLLPALKDAKKQEGERQQVRTQQRKHENAQDKAFAKENNDRKQSPGGSDPQNPENGLEQIKKETDAAKDKIKDAMKNEKGDENQGSPKGAGEGHADSKPGPQDAPEGPEPKQKDQGPMKPDDAGSDKNQGEGSGSSGESKDGGAKAKATPKESSSKGDRKDGPKNPPDPAKDQGGMGKAEPAGGAKDGGPMGMDAPMTPQPRENASEADAPAPKVKQEAQGSSDPKDTPSQGGAKGLEQEGPSLPPKDATETPNPSEAQAKAGGLSDPMAPKSPPKDAQPGQENPAGNARGEEAKKGEPSWDDLAKLIEKLPAKDAAAGKELADVAKNAKDERMRDVAKEALAKNQRDPATGQPAETKPNPSNPAGLVDPNLKVPGKGDSAKSGLETKGPNQVGTSGSSKGPGDDLKAAVANREFARRIGLMQLDDWKKKMTPDLMRKAGLSEAEWQRFLGNMQTYDALVRKLNAKLAKKADLHGGSRPIGTDGPQLLKNTPAANTPLDGGLALPPPELRDAQNRFTTRKTNP